MASLRIGSKELPASIPFTHHPTFLHTDGPSLSRTTAIFLAVAETWLFGLQGSVGTFGTYSGAIEAAPWTTLAARGSCGPSMAEDWSRCIGIGLWSKQLADHVGFFSDVVSIPRK